MKARGTSTISWSRAHVQKPSCAQSSRRTEARASAKVCRCFGYHAAPWMRSVDRSCCRWWVSKHPHADALCQAPHENRGGAACLERGQGSGWRWATGSAGEMWTTLRVDAHPPSTGDGGGGGEEAGSSDERELGGAGINWPWATPERGG